MVDRKEKRVGRKKGRGGRDRECGSGGTRENGDLEDGRKERKRRKIFGPSTKTV